jgi:hypothetical protein
MVREAAASLPNDDDPDADAGKQLSLDELEKPADWPELVMCAEKIRRLLRIFFDTIFAWVYARQSPGCLWMALRNICLLEATESLVTG